MSQAGIIDFQSSDPQIPTNFIANSGSAIPIANTIELLGQIIPASSIPFRSVASGNTVTYQLQTANASASSNANNAGVSSFNSNQFIVDSDGFVSFSGTGAAQTITGQTGGALSPAAGNWNIFGGTVGAGTSPLSSSGSGSTLTLNAQRSQAIASPDSTKVGLSNFNSSHFSVDGDGFVSLSGSGNAIDSVTVDQFTGPGTNPVLPDSNGNITSQGTVVVAGTFPVKTNSLSANSYEIQVQLSQALAATDSTKVGLSNFNSNDFSVDANGFVSLLSAGVFPWNDESGAFAAVEFSGYFVTDTATATLPGAPSQGDTISFALDTANVLTIQASGTQVIRVGSSVSSAAGTAVSTDIGDSITLVYRASSTSWIATSVIGTFTLA